MRRAGLGTTGKYDMMTSAPPTPDISVAEGLFSLAVTPVESLHCKSHGKFLLWILLGISWHQHKLDTNIHGGHELWWWQWWSLTHRETPQCELLSPLGRTNILNVIIFDVDNDDHRDHDDKDDYDDDTDGHLGMEVLGKELALAEPAEAAEEKYSMRPISLPLLNPWKPCWPFFIIFL